ncbi:MAG: hypothetical protein CL675_00015 [Bdellovibrionaceae bacterium]|nr:hypothetical protein [Pseudobdellovibrionaceae bacterium]
MSDVVVSVQQGLGVIALNRPKALNALSVPMYLQIEEALEAWRADSSVQAVFIHSLCEKAFSAGGDVKGVVQSLLSDDYEQAMHFFEVEYGVDMKLHSYPKPVLTFGHGYIFGGGLGVFQTGRYKLVAPSAVASMPEALIGFFPDVGSSFFLQKLPQQVRLLVALAGYRLNADELVGYGLADGVFGDSVQQLISLISSNLSQQCGLIDGLELDHGSQFKAIQGNHFQSLDEFGRWLDAQPGFEVEKQNYHSSSRLSLEATFQLFGENRVISIDQAFELDRRLAEWFSKTADFKAGVKAKLIDKVAVAEWPDKDRLFDFSAWV